MINHLAPHSTEVDISVGQGREGDVSPSFTRQEVGEEILEVRELFLQLGDSPLTEHSYLTLPSLLPHLQV